MGEHALYARLLAQLLGVLSPLRQCFHFVPTDWRVQDYATQSGQCPAKPMSSLQLSAQLSKTPVAGASRTVPLEGGHPAEGFAANDIKTAKYNVATFVPIFFWEMFSRVAYLYFLLQARALCPTQHLIAQYAAGFVSSCYWHRSCTDRADVPA